MTERHRVIPAVYLLLKRKDGKVLFTRRANTGYMDGKLGLPSGHLEGSETVDAATIREAKEEVGVDVKAKDMRFLHVMHRAAEGPDRERVDFIFETSVWKGKPYIAEPDKCNELVWVDPAALPADVIPEIVHMFEQIANGHAYSHHGFR